MIKEGLLRNFCVNTFFLKLYLLQKKHLQKTLILDLTVKKAINVHPKSLEEHDNHIAKKFHRKCILFICLYISAFQRWAPPPVVRRKFLGTIIKLQIETIV